MGTVIQASELEVGDLYRAYRIPSRIEPGGSIIRKITGARTVRTSETYRVLETRAIDGTQRGEISLRADISVERLDTAGTPAEIADTLSYMMPGEQLNIVYAEGRFWE